MSHSIPSITHKQFAVMQVLERGGGHMSVQALREHFSSEYEQGQTSALGFRNFINNLWSRGMIWIGGHDVVEAKLLPAGKSEIDIVRKFYGIDN